MDEDPKNNRLEKEMKEAWRQTPPIPIPEGWQRRVMDAVHEAALPGSPSTANQVFQKILWRCAVISACAASACFLFIPGTMMRPLNELVRVFMLDPAGFLRNLPMGY